MTMIDGFSSASPSQEAKNFLYHSRGLNPPGLDTREFGEAAAPQMTLV